MAGDRVGRENCVTEEKESELFSSSLPLTLFSLVSLGMDWLVITTVKSWGRTGYTRPARMEKWCYAGRDQSFHLPKIPETKYQQSVIFKRSPWEMILSDSLTLGLVENWIDCFGVLSLRVRTDFLFPTSPFLFPTYPQPPCCPLHIQNPLLYPKKSSMTHKSYLLHVPV